MTTLTPESLATPESLRPKLLQSLFESTESGELKKFNGQELTDALDLLDEALYDLIERRQAVYEVALEVIDEPKVATASGRILKPTNSKSQSGWKKDEFKKVVLAQRSKLLMDTETGERVRVIPVDQFGDTIEVRLGTNSCRGLGLDVKDFCTTKWTSKLEWMKR